MKMRIKKLKMQDRVSIRKTVQYVMQNKLKQWWTPLQMQAFMWKIGAKMSYTDVHSIMDDLYEDAKDIPFVAYERDSTCLCYRCLAYLTPNSN